ncbi:MAG: hypothetical protein AMJ79_13020 [Phycisphaerae bacterium SM23_30]|nr:MAG: hypothetical protein AMJ79_13020 [Phycisphaerae bacterium SM23_30]
MANFNKVILMGNLTRDPSLSYLPSQTPVVDFGIATNRRWTGSDGAPREETCFIDCRAFGRLAENINKYCRKGRPLMIEGRLTFDQWEGADGAKRSKHRITVQNFTFVDSRVGDQAPGEAAEAEPRAEGSAEPPPADDIPF